MKKINIGLIGCGRIAGHHFKAVEKNNNFKILSVCDLNKEKAKLYSKKYNVPYYGHFDEMLKNQKNLDIVAVMTPSGMHYEHSKNILNKFNVHLIVEKPTFLKSSQVTEIYALAKKKKKKIFPVFQNRYNKAIQRLKKAIQNKELGEIRVVSVRVRWCRPQTYYDLSVWRGTYSHDGGALTNQGIHHIDLLRYLFGNIKFLNAQMKTYGANIEVEDTITANFEFCNQSTGTLEITTSARPHDYEASISLVGSKGVAQVGGWAVNELQIFSPNPKICKKFSENIPDAYGFGHYSLYRDVFSSIQKKIKFPIDYKDCFESIRLLNSFYASAERKKTVIVKKIIDSKNLGRKNEKISKIYR